MRLAVHPALAAELRRLGPLGIGAAEARRRLTPLAARLGLPRPGYTAVLLVIQESPPHVPPAPGGPSALQAVFLGRMPTPEQLDASTRRARAHLRRRRLERERRALGPDPGGSG